LSRDPWRSGEDLLTAPLGSNTLGGRVIRRPGFFGRDHSAVAKAAASSSPVENGEGRGNKLAESVEDWMAAIPQTIHPYSRSAIISFSMIR
jgi:hypothetical protein